MPTLLQVEGFRFFFFSNERQELIGPGNGIHWPDLDEDISVAGLLGLPD